VGAEVIARETQQHLAIAIAHGANHGAALKPPSQRTSLTPAVNEQAVRDGACARHFDLKPNYRIFVSGDQLHDEWSRRPQRYTYFIWQTGGNLRFSNQ